MPATATRANFVLQEFRSAVWQNQNVRDLYGKVARDTKDAPIPTFFDSMDHVQAVANERGALLGQHARAFSVGVGQLMEIGGGMAMTQALPGARLEDEQLAAGFNCVIPSVEYDMESSRTTLALWGICGTIAES